MTPSSRWLPCTLFLAGSLLAACDDGGEGGEGKDTGPTYADADADGHDTQTDCDDANAQIHPGAEELCDGVDNDCDGQTDEDDASDALLWYSDGDGDGYGDDALTQTACQAPSSYVEQGGDCDDGDAQVNPGAGEVCDGSTDEDCDGLIDDEDPDLDEGSASLFYPDADGDGYGDQESAGELLCEASDSYPVSDHSDCDDNDERINPGQTEICDEADVDEDCSGAADDADPDVDPSSQTSWYADGDGDGYGDPATKTTACEQPSGTVTDDSDCDDGDAEVNPGAVEICDEDETDEDCSGYADDADPYTLSTSMTLYYPDTDGDGYGDEDSSGNLQCDASASMRVTEHSDCDDGDSGVNPGETEICDVLDTDEDCDGLADDDDPDVDSSSMSTWYPDDDDDTYGDEDSAGSLQCDADARYEADEAGDCDDDDANVNPGETEVCDDDDVDEDCDGLVNEDDSDVTDTLTLYPDQDRDGYGDMDNPVESCDSLFGYLEDGTDCDDGDAEVHPDAEETWYDGTDQDCDGASDYDADGDGYDSDEFDGEDCDDEDATVSPDGTDDTEDGVDQDCDGVDGMDGVDNLERGDLVICEVMQNPDAAADSVGEWFEIYNASGASVNLEGLEVYDSGSDSFTVEGSTPLEDGAYFIFGNDDDTSWNGGQEVDYVFDASAMALGNGSDEIYLANADGEIDSVAWDNGLTFPDPTGASMSLDPGDLSALLNDDGANWCEGISSFGDGDLGTPGSANDDCGGWEGTRELLLEIYGYGAVCDLWWDSYGTASSNICTGCDWAYDLEFSYIGDDLGGCNGESYLPAYTVGLLPGYYISGYGSYDMLLLYYGSTWYYQFFVDQYGGGSIDYYTWWYRYSKYGYYYLYYWYGYAQY